MKNTRKAASIWLAMSLAISTAFGNTAWGEIRPDTGNNRCVHVHTAECYKDADETATPSQIGREPTECTHICSVESGCIRDTEKEHNENADENKNLNDVAAQNGAALSVSTPSNAKDTTTTGGTVTPVPQTKILSWSWLDPEENLLDGRLELTGITEEAQPSFTEITEYLPSAIIARVEKKVKTEKTLKMGKKRICQSPTGAARSMCRTKKVAGRWKAPMSLKQSCRRGMSWQKAWTRWWWKCLWWETSQR